MVAYRPFHIAVIAALACSATALAQLPSTQLTSVFPPGGQQGTAVEVTIAGSDLDDVAALVFNQPGLTAKPKKKPALSADLVQAVPSQFAITIDDSVPAGIFEVRAVGRFGLSNPRSFVVGSFPERQETGGNTSAKMAVELPLGSTLCGRIEPSTFDFVRINLRKDEPVLLDVMARRIDSRLDATLTILDPAGRELKRVKQGAGADPVVVFAAPADGAYLLKLSDEVYGGGNDFFYRLTASRAPHVAYVFPPSGIAGSTATYAIYGRNLPGGKPANGLSMDGLPLETIETSITLPADEEAAGRLELSGAWPLSRAWQDGIEFRLPSPGGPANPVTIFFARSPQIVSEREPNNRPSEAQQITLPCELVGQFYPERDFDWVEFDAKKGQTWWIEAISNQLGLASDPSLILYRVKRGENGQQQQTEIAQADDLPERGRRNPATDEFDATSDDPAYKFVVPEDGTYRLLIRDQFGDGRQDPSFVYRLAIRKPAPDFRLLAYTTAPAATPQMQTQTPLTAASIRRGGTAAFNLVVQRRDDFDGEIQVAVEGLPAGVTSPGAVLGGDVTTGTLVLVAADDAAAHAGPIRIVARATVGRREVVREARYAVVVWGTTNRTQQPAEFRLAPGLALGVIDKDTDPALIRIGEDKIYETSIGGSLQLPVAVTRRGDYNDPIKLTAVGLTQQMRPKDITLAAGAKEGQFELALNQQNIRPGAYTFYMKGESKRKFARNPEAVASCEAEQKRLDELINALNDEIKAAAEKKDPSLMAAQARLKEALEQKTQCAKRLDDARKASQPREIPIALISTPVKLRIHASPIRFQNPPAELHLAAGGTAPLSVAIQRLYGFADQIELTLEPPPEARGLAAPKVTLNQDESEAKMELTAAAQAAAGQHACTLRARGRFNNVQIETTTPITVVIPGK